MVSAAVFGVGGYFVVQTVNQPSPVASSDLPAAPIIAIEEVASTTPDVAEPAPEKTSPAVKTQAVTQPLQTTQIIDVCLNIEGIQTSAPSGYSSTANTCTLIEVVDLCPNIPGVQTSVPVDMVYSRTYDKCLTEDELNKLDENTNTTSKPKVVEEQVPSTPAPQAVNQQDDKALAIEKCKAQHQSYLAGWPLFEQKAKEAGQKRYQDYLLSLMASGYGSGLITASELASSTSSTKTKMEQEEVSKAKVQFDTTGNTIYQECLNSI